MSVIVKHGDRGTVTTWTANVDLTGSTVVLVASLVTGGPLITLSSSITDATHGVVTHITDGTVPVGTYNVELKVTQGGLPVWFPNIGYETLIVNPQLDGS